MHENVFAAWVTPCEWAEKNFNPTVAAWVKMFYVLSTVSLLLAALLLCTLINWIMRKKSVDVNK